MSLDDSGRRTYTRIMMNTTTQAAVKAVAVRLGSLVDDDAGFIAVSPRDRLRVCDASEEQADEYVERKTKAARKALADAGITGVGVDIGEKGHIEFTF